MLGKAFSIAIVTGLLALIAATPAGAAPAVSGEIPLKTEINANNKIIEGPDGNIWVTLNGPKDVAKITPAGLVSEYDLGIEGAGGIAVSPAKEIWITRNGGVTQFDPSNPEVLKKSTLVEPLASGPIVLGPDGNFWAAANEKLVRISPANAEVSKAFTVAGLNPRDIKAAGSLLAIADFNSRILTATTTDPPTTTEYELKGGSQGVAGNAAGQVAFSQQGQMPTEVGLLQPPGPPLMTSSPGTDPFGVALGPDGAFWFAQFNIDTVGRLGADNLLTNLTPGFAKGSGPRQIAAGPGNTLWVTLQNNKKIGRVSGVENAPPPPLPPPLVTKPRTNIEKGPKGVIKTTRKRVSVSFRFSSPDAGAGFECRIKRLGKKGAKKATSSKAPVFKACKSPKKLKLGSGRYRFEVRAVLAGIADETPAVRGFRVVRLSR
jgi:streptogramin lyase